MHCSYIMISHIIIASHWYRNSSLYGTHITVQPLQLVSSYLSMLHVYVCLCMQHEVAIASYMATKSFGLIFIVSTGHHFYCDRHHPCLPHPGLYAIKHKPPIRSYMSTCLQLPNYISSIHINACAQGFSALKQMNTQLYKIQKGLVHKH